MIHPPDQLPAFVISLDRASERRTRFFEAAERHGWNVTTFPATDLRDLRIERLSMELETVHADSEPPVSITGLRGADGNRGPGDGAYACAVSHLRAWKWMIEEGHRAICVFEDDAVIERQFDLPSLPSDADFVFINDRVSALVPDEIMTEGELPAWVAANPFAPLVPGCGMEAYIVTDRGAAKAIALLEKMSSPIDLQLLACGHGTALASHSLGAIKPEGAPLLQIYATTRPYTRHEDFGVSYLNGTNAFEKVQFGSGGFEIPGWVNCDLPEHDITKPLGLASESADFLFAEHVIEHVPPRDAWNFIVECRRVLKPGGVLRLCFPDIKRILTAESGGFDRLCQQSGWSDGTREGSVRATLFCHGHLGAWTADSLTTLLAGAGFGVSECRPGQSIHPELQGVDQHWKTVGSEINEIETTVLEGRKLIGALEARHSVG